MYFRHIILFVSIVVLSGCAGSESADKQRVEPSSFVPGEGWELASEQDGINSELLSEVSNNISLPEGSFSYVSDSSFGPSEFVALTSEAQTAWANTSQSFSPQSNSVTPVSVQRDVELPYVLLVETENKDGVKKKFVTKTDTVYLSEEFKIVLGHQLRKGMYIRKSASELTAVEVVAVISGSYKGKAREITVPGVSFAANDFVISGFGNEDGTDIPEEYYALGSDSAIPTEEMQSLEIGLYTLSDGAFFEPHESYYDEYQNQGHFLSIENRHQTIGATASVPDKLERDPFDWRNAIERRQFVETPILITPENDADPLGINRPNFNNVYAVELDNFIESLNTSAYGHKNPTNPGPIRFFVDKSCGALSCPLREPNAYAWYDRNKKPIIGINYGLLRTSGLSFDAIALVVSHEVGHHLPELYPETYGGIGAPLTDLRLLPGENPFSGKKVRFFCEAPSDYFGARDVQRAMWGDKHSQVTTKGSKELMDHFFVGPQPKVTRCGHPPKRCREMFYSAGMNMEIVSASHECRSREQSGFPIYALEDATPSFNESAATGTKDTE